MKGWSRKFEDPITLPRGRVTRRELLPRRRWVGVSLRRPAVRRRLRSISGLAPLRCQSREVLLAGLQGCGVGARRAFRVHPKPYGPDDDANDTRSDVLGGLHALLVGELFGLLVVALNFCPDHRAVGIGVLWLNSRDRLRVTSGASR